MIKFFFFCSFYELSTRKNRDLDVLLCCSTALMLCCCCLSEQLFICQSYFSIQFLQGRASFFLEYFMQRLRNICTCSKQTQSKLLDVLYTTKKLLLSYKTCNLTEDVIADITKCFIVSPSWKKIALLIISSVSFLKLIWQA